MKKSILVFFSFICMLLVFQKSWVWIDYELNIDWYMENCVNKDKPQMHCDGKCQMTKEADKSPTMTWVKVASEFIGVLPHFALTTIAFFTTPVKIFIHQSSNFFFEFYSNILKPPALAYSI